MPVAGLMGIQTTEVDLRRVNPNERTQAQPSRIHDTAVFMALVPVSILRASDQRLMLDFIMNTILYVHRQYKCRLLSMLRLLPDQVFQG